MTVNGTVKGGNGGGANFKGGGNGGVGIAMDNGTITVNAGAAVTGGNGGTGNNAFTTLGLGAEAIIGHDLTVINSGSISAGINITTKAGPPNAISFTGGDNRLELQAGSVITGNVVVSGAGSTGTLTLGGNTTDATTTFDVTKLGAQYQGFTAFEKSGAGTWTLTGSTAAVTNWTLNAGTLSVGSEASLGAGSSLLTFNGGILQVTGTDFTSMTRQFTWGANGGGFDIADPANNFTVSQSITGGGSLTKLGSGTLTLSGTNTYTGDTTVNAGELIVNGSIASSSLTTVNANAVLSGTGTASAVQINAGGAFAPSNGIPGSSMTVASLTMQSGAFYMASLNPGGSSYANVTGNATLGGATVVANATGADTFVDKRYTILTANRITGMFDPTVTGLPSDFKPSLSQDPNNVYLNLKFSILPPDPSDSSNPSGPSGPSGRSGDGLNTNQLNVGTAAVNFFNTEGRIPLAFGSLTPQGLTQISGETATGAQQTTFQAMTQFIDVLTDPFAAGRGGDANGGGASATGFAEESMAYAGRAQANNPRDALAAFTKAPPLFAQRWNV